MEPIVDASIPVVTFLMMVAVGHGLTVADLRRSATDLRAVVTATLGQLILLPLIATVIVLVFNPAPAIIAGLVLVAACPGGTISNFYTCLAKANSALSLTLTAISCLASFVTLPVLVAAGFFFWFDDQPEIEVPVMVLVIQLLFLVALPTCLGMILRRWRPAATERRDLALRRVSLLALVSLVIYIVYDQWDSMVAGFAELTLVAVIFTALAMARRVLPRLGYRSPRGRPADLSHRVSMPKPGPRAGGGGDHPRPAGVRSVRSRTPPRPGHGHAVPGGVSETGTNTRLIPTAVRQSGPIPRRLVMSHAAPRAFLRCECAAHVFRPRFRILILPLLLLLTASLACASSSKEARGRPGNKMQITPGQLQIKVRALADPFSGIIEETVWELWETDQDPVWRKTVLIWQINVVNAVQRATFQPVPLAALFDTWGLVEQLRDYAETGARLDRTEEQVRIVLNAVDRMEASILKIAIEAGGEEGAAKAGHLIREWANENPIDKFATRTSTESELAQWTARGNMGALATVKSPRCEPRRRDGPARSLFRVHPETG